VDDISLTTTIDFQIYMNWIDERFVTSEKGANITISSQIIDQVTNIL